jgi:UDP-N-acetylglucosamine 2-epimerase
LEEEGIYSTHYVGDVMLDAMMYMCSLARRKSDILARLNISSGQYSLVTIHRAANTDNSERLSQIITTLNQVGEVVVFPVHPRTRNALDHLDLPISRNLLMIEPVGYLEMLVLEENARLIATDSGGVQREAYFLGIPCLTLRDETEWVETVRVGWNLLVGVEPGRILEAWRKFSPPADHPNLFGDGTAAQKIAQILSREPVVFGHSTEGCPLKLSNSTIELIGDCR